MHGEEGCKRRGVGQLRVNEVLRLSEQERGARNVDIERRGNAGVVRDLVDRVSVSLLGVAVSYVEAPSVGGSVAEIHSVRLSVGRGYLIVIITFTSESVFVKSDPAVLADKRLVTFFSGVFAVDRSHYRRAEFLKSQVIAREAAH